MVCRTDLISPVLHNNMTTMALFAQDPAFLLGVGEQALDEDSDESESPMDEETLMTPDECAAITISSIEKNKRNIIMTFTGKRTILFSRFFS